MDLCVDTHAPAMLRQTSTHYSIVVPCVSQLCAVQVLPGGRVIWRSAAEVPPYAKLIADAGFKVKCLQQAKTGYMDRVNMYSSFWVAERI